MAGLEVDEIHSWWVCHAAFRPQTNSRFTGLEWDREKIVVAQIDEVMPHPNADRLVLCKLNDGKEEHMRVDRRPQPVSV